MPKELYFRSSNLILILRYLFAILFLPILLQGQWAMPHKTAPEQFGTYGNPGYTFDGYLSGDKLVTFGMVNFGDDYNSRWKSFQDYYHLSNGNFDRTVQIFTGDAGDSSEHRGRIYRRYANGYIANERSTGPQDSVRYLLNFDGSLVRKDSALRTLIPTNQRRDSTQTFLAQDPEANLILLDWQSGDTVQMFLADSIAAQYTGGLDPEIWEVAAYHNDGKFVYLRVFIPWVVFSYGLDILKFDIASGRLVEHLNFRELEHNVGSGQAFRLLVTDSLVKTPGKFRRYLSIYDANRQKLHSLSYEADNFYGWPSGSNALFFTDSLLIIGTTISDNRVHPNQQIRGTHLRVYDLLTETWIGSARFRGRRPGHNFDVEQFFGVHNGLMYFTTDGRIEHPDRDLLVCLPLNLKYDNSLYDRKPDESLVPLIRTMEIYPNPTKDRLQVAGDLAYSHLIVHSLAGDLMAYWPRTPDNAYSLASLAPGIYVVSLLQEDHLVLRNRIVVD